MKVSYCLFIVLICWSGCKNYSREKTPEKDFVTEKTQKKLGELLSSETAVDKDSSVKAMVTANMGTVTLELTSYEVDKKQECEKCDRRKVLAASQNIDNLNGQLIYNFLCTFDESCSINVEYSEFSNDVLYKILSKHPKAIVKLIADNPELNSEAIYKQIASPLLDYNYNSIVNSMKEIEGNEEIKTRIIDSVKKAIEG